MSIFYEIEFAKYILPYPYANKHYVQSVFRYPYVLNMKKAPTKKRALPYEKMTIRQAYVSPASLGFPLSYHRRVDRTKFSTSNSHLSILIV